MSRFDYAALAAGALLVAALLLAGCQDPKRSDYPSIRPQPVNPCAYPDCKSRLYKKPAPA